jgi:hypothetical protein
MTSFQFLSSLAAAASLGAPQSPIPSPVVRVIAGEYAFQLPSRVRAGLTTIRLVNTGKEPHVLRLSRMPDGKTLADFNAARLARLPFPTMPVGSPAPVLAGDSADITLRIEPGRYLALCGYPAPDGKAHFELGMFAEMIVEPSAEVVTPPSAEVTLTLSDYAFQLSAPITRATRSLHIVNSGSQVHQAFILAIQPGTSVEDEVALLKQGYYKGRDARRIRGVLEVPIGGEAWTTLALDPGEYLIACNAAGPERSRHLDRGMIQRVIVR